MLFPEGKRLFENIFVIQIVFFRSTEMWRHLIEIMLCIQEKNDFLIKKKV